MGNPQQTNPNSMTQDHDQEQEVSKPAIRLTNAVVLPMVLKSALELNLLDTISAAGDGAFLSPSELASQLSTKNPDAAIVLDRMLRLLASYDILKCSLRTGEDGGVERSYGAGPLCKFFARNQDGGSVADMFLFLHDKVMIESWYHWNDAVLEGGIPFNRAHGMSLFEYPGQDQRFNRLLNQAMSSFSTFTLKKLLDVYKGFDGTKVLVDVGGNSGITLHAITSKYPGIKGINFDLPHVLADAPNYSGVEHLQGDMFVSVPKGDTIFIKNIFHDWSDEHCVTILKNCWEALPYNGKVVNVECHLPVVPENNVTSHTAFSIDLYMFALTPGGKERTQEEFEALAAKSGFGYEVICSAYGFRVAEFHKKARA
ncbi:Methyltransf_2 domain-containing protein/Dimerisation domain-containing protein [Cephalotus follicularis]|uniref:caffeate O-methyltransferase n=1 Tax=Cephalotus follicularis TaxID=3775 RepID=A0A1Q3CND8_CEPFO|nr:Methyltransf_2 domain-containing protein/Dimerisation domain-containing protein [Cephalotus follicularis]